MVPLFIYLIFLYKIPTCVLNYIRVSSCHVTQTHYTDPPLVWSFPRFMIALVEQHYIVILLEFMCYSSYKELKMLKLMEFVNPKETT